MGIGSAVKNMLSTDDTAVDNNLKSGARESTNATNTYETQDNFPRNRSSNQLPPGTGPGTSGKPAELATQNGLEHPKAGQDTFGYGTDAAAAVGGTLAGTHQGTGSFGNGRTAARNSFGSGTASGHVLGPTAYRKSMEGDQLTTGGQAPPVNWARGTSSDTEGPMRATTTYKLQDPKVDQTGVLEEGHGHGHIEHNASDSMPSGSIQQTTSQLHPIIHEKVRHLEIEEISHVKDLERHIHHVQHHTQPVTLSEELQGRVRQNFQPTTHIKEIHANKPEDSTVFKTQVFQHQDNSTHLDKERQVIDKGTTVNEIIHHHVHHVIQPVIEKETIAKEYIHTTIPIREESHEAPVIHRSQLHDPVDMKHFLKGGGTVEGGVRQNDIFSKVLHSSGKCVREVQGNKNVQGTLQVPTAGTSLVDDSKTGAQRNSSLNQVPSRN